ncbi:MAG TPA: haloacid dehalogenase type II [Candidatus Binatia bacterium]|nr:haloacid dehalogenase type II [Candidatus Sulfotelmatobacter sp.]HXJ85959.1 haloacid dehalogenase type II [Candidatus Binatia bacterium]
MFDFSRFEILTFDCYGTLINWEAGLLPALRRILWAHSSHMDDVHILQLYGDCEQRAEQPPYRSYRDVLGSVVRDVGKNCGFSPTADEVQSLADSLPTWQPWPDTVGALHQLKTRFRLAILSNIDDDLFERTRPQLEVIFDEVVTAQQAQAYKPSLKLFELALSRIQAPAHRVLHVGQSIYHDVIPAQALGLATVWVNRPSARPGVGAVKSADAKPDIIVTSLEELAAFIFNA